MLQCDHQELNSPLPSINSIMSDKEEPPAQDQASFDSKRSVREKVWDYMEKNELCNYPRPTVGRIPNFKGAEEAAKMLSQLDVFKTANVIKVNPDKPQEALRFLALQAKKKLVVPIPRLRTGLFQLVGLPDDAGIQEMKIAASRRGSEQYGAAIGVGSDVKISLVVVGAIAVSRQGQRIGKGEGFADLEYGMLAGMGALTPDAIVVATVHDCQVFDTLPAHLFEPYDVPIDIIVTPTQVIYVTPRAAKPKGIIWRFLSHRRVSAVSILQTFLESQLALGVDCTLKEVDSEVEERPPRVSNGRASGGGGDARPRVRRRRVRSSKTPGDENGEARKAGEGDEEGPRPARPQRRRVNSARKPKEGEEENTETNDRSSRRRPIRPRQRPAIEFSLRVGNISADARVRDLKNALAERGVKPSDITWRGQRGFAYLHFCAAKPGKVPPAEPVDPLDSNQIVASLQDMRLVSEGGEETALKIEPAKPVTRIETTDITAV